MKGSWVEAVQNRLETDSEYRQCKAEEDEIYLKLMSALSEEQKELFLDFLCAQRLAESLEQEHIYETGWTNGRRSKK